MSLLPQSVRYSRLLGHNRLYELTPSVATVAGDLDDSALGYYEKFNLSWRAQFSSPALARHSIGSEFMLAGKRQRSSPYGTMDDIDAENSQNGWSCLFNRCRL
ncbi:uncharacterized protein LOC108599160 [Drosophila busckii]|uniref:uncharacterized protein LOC108599160 n=1 Tax=Drosophila busckii TaxID=30019 RepID=UPI00083EECDC|nr:uncharacterized protein LOC108599160 [Drosophila busckii]